jgi:hypothetical protein
MLGGGKLFSKFKKVLALLSCPLPFSLPRPKYYKETALYYPKKKLMCKYLFKCKKN